MRFPYIALPTRQPVYPLEAPRSVIDPWWRSRSADHPVRVSSVRLSIPGPMTRCSPLPLPRAWGSIGLELPLGKPGVRGLTDSLPLRAGAATFVRWV